MITLGDGVTSLTLHHVLWTNRAAVAGIAGSEQVTLGGRLVVQRSGGSGGRQIILSASLDGSRLRGWFTWDQVEQLMAWRDAGDTLTLNYDGEERTAVIPLAGIDLEPVRPASNAPESGDVYAGTLTLMET